MKALLLDTINKTTQIVNPEGLQDYYKLINCQWIDIVTRKIGRKYYDIICDDEGTFVEDPLISAIDDFGRVMLVGNLIICGVANEEGDLTDLDANDIRYIKKRIQKLDTRKHSDLLMLTNCNYCYWIFTAAGVKSPLADPTKIYKGEWKNENIQ